MDLQPLIRLYDALNKKLFADKLLVVVLLPIYLM